MTVWVKPTYECEWSSGDSWSWAFVECRDVLPTTQVAYRKGLGLRVTILSVFHTFPSALARIVLIDISAAFESANHQGILFKHCPVGVGGYVLSVLEQFPSNPLQWVMVDGCRNKLVSMEVHRAAFWNSSCSTFTPRSFSPYLRTSFIVMLTISLWMIYAIIWWESSSLRNPRIVILTVSGVTITEWN